MQITIRISDAHFRVPLYFMISLREFYQPKLELGKSETHLASVTPAFYLPSMD